MFTIYQNKIHFKGYTVGDISSTLPPHVRGELERTLERLEEPVVLVSAQNPRANPKKVIAEMNRRWGKK